jgi:hypothetical protein
MASPPNQPGFMGLSAPLCLWPAPPTYHITCCSFGQKSNVLATGFRSGEMCLWSVTSAGKGEMKVNRALIGDFVISFMFATNLLSALLSLFYFFTFHMLNIDTINGRSNHTIHAFTSPSTLSKIRVFPLCPCSCDRALLQQAESLLS